MLAIHQEAVSSVAVVLSIAFLLFVQHDGNVMYIHVHTYNQLRSMCAGDLVAAPVVRVTLCACDICLYTVLIG